MAALTVTPANVQLMASSGTVLRYQAGEAVTQGEYVYQSDSDQKYYLADNATDEEHAKAVLAVLTPAAADEYFMGAAAGQNIDPGATLTKAEIYVVGTTDGAIEPIGDLVTTEWVRIIGYASATDTLHLLFEAGEFQK